ncbi:MAG: transporter substrate-binding domain-containing protein [Proteobacteria bacterium]|nr:transporter substrate-binding domain-containing protein [Pseudomonadota bacterium]
MRWALPFVLLWMISSTCFASDELYFAGLDDAAPFSYEENGVIKGYDYDIFMEMMQRAGYTVKVELLPFKRSWHYLINGAVDGTFMIYYKEERKAHLLYCETPIHVATYHLFVKKGHEFPFNGVNDLYGKKVANQSGFFVSNEFDQAVKNKKIILEEALSCDMNLKKLMSGRVDCYISSARLIRPNILELGIQHDIVQLPVPVLPNKGLYIALSLTADRIKDKAAFVRMLGLIRQTMDKDGTMDKINAKYFH